MSVLITILSVILCFVSIAMIGLVLMQKAKSDGGVAAMGGGVAESTFGAETGNVLTRGTRNAAIAFFTLSLVLYLANIYQARHRGPATDRLPTVIAPASTAKPVTAPALPTPAPANAQPAAKPANAPAKP